MISARSTLADAEPQHVNWTLIGAIIFTATAFAAEQGVTYPLISLLLEKRDVSESIIGLNVVLFTAGLASTTFAMTILVQHFSMRMLMLAGLFGSSLLLCSFYFLDSVVAWGISRFFLGFFASLIYIVGETLLNEAAPERLRGRIAGFYAAGLSLGFAIGPLAIPIFGTETKIAFLAVAFFVVLIGLIAAKFIRGDIRERTDFSSQGVTGFIRHAPAIFGMALAFGYADTVAISLLPVYLVQNGYSENFAAVTVSMIALPTAFAQPLIGLMLDRMSRVLVSTACCLVAGTAFWALTVVTSEASILGLYALIGTSTIALYTCALTILGERYTGGMLVAGSAALSLAYALGGVATLGTGIAMEGFGPVAAPISVTAIMIGFAVWFGSLRKH